MLTIKSSEDNVTTMVTPNRFSKSAWASRISWTGQTVASLCWIISVFVYSESIMPASAGDWLQLGAAFAWLIANLFALADSDAE